MKLIIITVMAFALPLTFAKETNVQNFLINYLQCKNIYAVTLLICWTKSGNLNTFVTQQQLTNKIFPETFQIFKAMNSANIRVNSFTPNHCHNNNCSLRNVSSRTMIILDISCGSALVLFKQVIVKYCL